MYATSMQGARNMPGIGIGSFFDEVVLLTQGTAQRKRRP